MKYSHNNASRQRNARLRKKWMVRDFREMSIAWGRSRGRADIATFTVSLRGYTHRPWSLDGWPPPGPRRPGNGNQSGVGRVKRRLEREDRARHRAQTYAAERRGEAR